MDCYVSPCALRIERRPKGTKYLCQKKISGGRPGRGDILKGG